MDEEETEEKVKPSICSKLLFQRIAALCERISKTQGKDKKKDVMKKFISDWRAEHKRIHGDTKTDDSFFPVMRFFLPHLDKDRLSYGMKEVVLAKYYIEALTLSKESDDAKRMLNYRAPSSAKQDAGDFASVLYAVLLNRCPEKGNLTVDDINNSLDLMAQSNAEGRRDITKKEIQKVIRNTSALEQKWLIRIMLKEMKLGLNENSVLPIFHPEALELYNVCNSLSKVCVDLHNINTKLNETEIMLCTPFRPMLGQRAVIDEVEKIIPQNIFIIETKIDGERMQLHKNGDEFRYFSRNSNDYTQSFGATRYRGTLTPYISDSFKANVKTCILDGEMVGYDPATNDFVLKGSNVDVKSDNLTGCQPCFVAFDVLLINDEKLANVSLKERIQKLEGVFDVTKGRIQHVERKIGSTSEDVVAAVNDAIDRREEGIVIKDPTSCYKPSKRKGSGWLKIKPEYVDSLSDELDLIILGGQYGSGHRGGMISHFLLGVADKQDESEKHPKTFLTFGKVGSGYSDAELKSLLDKLRKHWVKFDARNPPKNIQFSNGFKEKPDVVISPENSVIVQVKAAEISPSDKYKCGCTLRFPRVEKIRDDKDWFDCMTFKELEDLKQIADGKLTYLNTDGVTSEPAKKKRRVAAHFERPRAVAEHFKGADVSSIQEVSQLFADKEFCVINGPAEYSKQDIEKKIVECGGRFVQNPSADTLCVLAHKTNFRTKNIINRGSIDVVATSWILECFEKQSLIPYQPSDMLFATAKTQTQFRKQFDHYGDNYMEDVTEEVLKEIFDKMDEVSSLSNKEIADLEEKYFVNNSKEGLFRRKRLFVPADSGNDGDKLAYAEQEFLYHGGEKSESLEKASHVLVQQSISQEKLSDLRSHIRKLAKKPYLITKNWVYDSVDAAKLLNEGPYEP